MGYTFVLGLGAQKSGTSWLYRYLAEHPQCALSRLKEMHFWNELHLPEDAALARRYYSGWLGRIATRIAEGEVPGPEVVAVAKDLIDRAAMAGDPAAYRRYFDQRVGAARVTGEITPAYSRLTAPHLRSIRDLFPDVRPILLMRDPVTRFWSAVRAEARGDLASALALVPKKLAARPFLERGAYHRTAEAMLEVFGAALLLYSEDLFILGPAKVTAFLGLDPHPADLTQRENATALVGELPPDLARQIYEAHRETYAWAAARPEPLPAAWRTQMEAFGEGPLA